MIPRDIDDQIGSAPAPYSQSPMAQRYKAGSSISLCREEPLDSGCFAPLWERDRLTVLARVLAFPLEAVATTARKLRISRQEVYRAIGYLVANNYLAKETKKS